MINLIYPENNAIISTQTSVQKEFIEKIHTLGTENALEWLFPVKSSFERSYPEDLTIKWESDESFFEVEFSENSEFINPKIYKTNENQLTLSNLKINQDYFIKINGENLGHFKTANEGYRFLKVDGILNVRDLGGINIKQGLLYRGTDLDETFFITEKGKDTFINELNVKTELNVRIERHFDKEFSVAGNEVKYVYLPYRPYIEIFEDAHRKNICKIFDFFADESNYPIYFHCYGGADRTGMLAIYLRAIMNESDEDILTDYELTSLSKYAGGKNEGVNTEGFRCRNSSYFKEFMDVLYKEYGENEKLSTIIPKFLISCGIKEETLEKVRNIIANK